LCLSVSCHKNKISTSNEKEIIVKTIKWKMQKDFEIKDIVKDIQYVKLEDNVESFFSNIDKLIIKNNKIYLLDITGPTTLFVFNINGEFLHKIGKQGQGPGEYSHSLINFDVNNDTVFLYDYAKRKMMTYDGNGNYIRSINSSFSFNDFCFLPENQYLLSLDIFEKKNNMKKVMLTNKLSQQGISYFNFHKNYKNDKLNSRSFQATQEDIAYMSPVSDTLFVFSKEGALKHAYFFDFGNQKLPEELKNYYEKTVEDRRKGIYYTYILNTPIMIDNYIFANMLIENQKCIAAFDIANHTSTYELLSPEKFSLKNINFPLCTVSDSLLVSYIDSNLYDAIKGKLSINPEIDEHLSNGGVILCLNKIR
jgi:hypothetical protein